MLLVAGAASGSRPGRTGASTAIVVVVVTVGLLVSLVLPFLADRQLAQAAHHLDTPERAAEALDRARELDPWNADTLSFEGRLAELQGEFGLAAARYGSAASLSQRPWLLHFRQARALKRLGSDGASRTVCRRAMRENPGELDLHGGPCTGDFLVSRNPARSDPLPLAGRPLAGSVYVFVTAPPRDTEVSFFLDDPSMKGPPRTVETRPPYDLGGSERGSTRSVAEAVPFETTMLADGRHTLTVAIDLGRGDIRVLTVPFTVANG
jgi:hypothetical protein